MNIGARVKERRSLLEISQQKLANEIGVSVDTIRSIEINRVKPSIETLINLANFFDCTLDYLVGRSDDPNEAAITNWSYIQQGLYDIMSAIAENDKDFEEKLKLIYGSFPKVGRIMSKEVSKGFAEPYKDDIDELKQLIYKEIEDRYKEEDTPE